MAVFVVGWVVRRKLRSPEPYVIGEQMAHAERAEHARLSNPSAGPSPLPANQHYDSSLGDFDLLTIKISADDQLSACRFSNRSALADRDFEIQPAWAISILCLPSVDNGGFHA